MKRTVWLLSKSICILCAIGWPCYGAAQEAWTIVIPPAYADDAAIGMAAEDIRDAGQALGLRIEPLVTRTLPDGNAIVCGRPSVNSIAADFERRGIVEFDTSLDEQGFELRAIHDGDHRLLFVAGGSILGDVYGLYWVWDRLQVNKGIPELNETREPRLKIRLCGAANEDSLRGALRHTATWVSRANGLELMTWGAEPEDSENARNREKWKPIIDKAHALHLKFLVDLDEFTYLSAWLERQGAALTPEDPKLWDALQAKYRALFTAMPELDGVQIRTGELTRVYGAYRAFDIMHDPPDCPWPLDQRYRTFLRKMHEVAVGEFGKIYFHRTWVTNTTEQHSQADVYRSIFTDEVPTENLYTSPYMSTGDRWYYQPYNPTFNQTPHKMLALLATLDYHAHAGVNVFPSFPGQYHQGGLQGVLSDPNTNLAGVHFAAVTEPRWDTQSLTAYTVFRLAWDPDEDPRQIAEDFTATHLGREAAPAMAEALLLSRRAYEDGVYIKPVAESLSFNTLPHLRLTTFQIRGYPEIDGGKEHIEWLRSSMYEPCKGREDETLAYLHRGLTAARQIRAKFEQAVGSIADAALREQVGNSVALTNGLVETNVNYVRTCLAYFAYRDNPSAQTKVALAEALHALEASRVRFVETPGCVYQLFGVDALMRSARAVLDNLEKAEADLAAAPDSAEVLTMIADAQAAHRAALERAAEKAVKVLHWRGRVDGKDILEVQGHQVRIHHIQADPIHSVEQKFTAPLPQTPGTVLVKDIESAALHPFVLEQPSPENGHTAKIALFDLPPGYVLWEFELYFVEESPESLGVVPPWRRPT